MPVVSEDLAVSLHTVDGVQLYQFPPTAFSTCRFTRVLRDASQLELRVPADGDVDRFPDVVPWLHWVSLWEQVGFSQRLVWTGPVQRRGVSRTGMALQARDSGAYLSRTRDPITKRWDAADPATIAEELWDAMIDLHGLKTRPIMRPDPEGDRFDFHVTADEQMLDQTMSDLVQLGLRWSVVSGTPILGPLPLEPVATLGAEDFLGDIELVRDGTASFNDILLRVPGEKVRAREPMHGQNLQTISTVDRVSGVSNARRAAQQYARHTAQIRDALTLPGATRLHPDAPVVLQELMPSTRFVVEALGVRALMELESVDVTVEKGDVAVSVSMESVIDKPELADVQAAAGGGGLGGLQL